MINRAYSRIDKKWTSIGGYFTLHYYLESLLCTIKKINNHSDNNSIKKYMIHRIAKNTMHTNKKLHDQHFGK